MAFSNQILVAVIAASAVVFGAEGFAPSALSHVVSSDGWGLCLLRASWSCLSVFGDRRRGLSDGEMSGKKPSAIYAALRWIGSGCFVSVVASPYPRHGLD